MSFNRWLRDKLRLSAGDQEAIVELARVPNFGSAGVQFEADADLGGTDTSLVEPDHEKGSILPPQADETHAR